MYLVVGVFLENVMFALLIFSYLSVDNVLYVKVINVIFVMELIFKRWTNIRIVYDSYLVIQVLSNILFIL